MSLFLPALDRATFKKRRNALLVVVGCLIAGIAAYKPAIKAYKSLHARKQLAEGEAYLAQNRKPEALAAARAAMAEGNGSVRAHRLLLKAAGPEPAQDTVNSWMALASRSDATLDDRRELASFAVRWGVRDWAEEQWRFLQLEKPLPLASLRIGAALHELRGDAGKAVLFARAVLEQSSNEEGETRFLLGRVLLQAGGMRDQEIGKRLLLEQAAGSGTLALHILRLLSSSGLLAPFEASECQAKLERHPRRERIDILTSAGFQWQTAPYKKQQVLAEAATEFRKQGGPIVELGRWLAQVRAPGEILRQVSPEQARSSSELALIYVDALGALDRWAETDSFLASGNLPITPIALGMYQARVAERLQQPRIAQLRWEQALKTAGKDAQSLLRVAEFAVKNGKTDVAEAACRQIIESAPQAARAAFEQMVKIHRSDLNRLFTVLEEMAQRFPDDAAIQNDLAYTSIMLSKPSEKALEHVRAALATNENFLAYKTTLALAFLAQGATSNALALYGGQPIYWPELQPHHQAVYAAVSGAAGETERARTIARAIDLDRLREPERKLIQQWL